MNVLRRIFWILNKFFMVPCFRLGFGPLMGTPYGGYVMILKNVGRKTGKLRYTPVNYAIKGGDVYCLAGFGKTADWYLNLKADPNIEVIMPGGTIAATASEVPQSEDWLAIIRQILKNSGFATFLAGINPFALSDEELFDKTKDYVLFRLHPTGIGNGPSDAGGWVWLWVTAAMLLLLWLILR